MIAFFTEHWGTLLVGAILAAAVVLVLIHLYRNRKKGGSSCGCGCDHCPSACHHSKHEKGFNHQKLK